MKQVSVDNLKENDILAFPILSHSGTVLIHADVALTDELIERAINLGVRTVYIKDEKEGIVRENTSDSDTAREEEEYPYRLEETTNNSRQIVKKILEKHIYKHNEELKIIVNEAQRILDTVIAEPEVVNNITEIRNVSTDMYTHCINVCTLSTIMALRLKMSNKQIHNIAMGAILHDIGLRYINVPYVNVSENKMTNKDAVEYKKHTIFGYSSVQDEDWIPDIAKEIILLHHERIDGKGYPFSHKGDKLKMEVKLVSLCDDFDSLISGVGNPKLKIYEAIEYIKANQGLKYDATIAEKLLETVAVQNQQIAEMQPKASYYDLILQNKNTVPITQIAKDYGMSGRKFNELLHELGVQYKFRKTWLLYQHYAECGYTQSRTYAIDESRSVMHTYWTQKGRLFLYDLLKSEGILPVIEQED